MTLRFHPLIIVALVIHGLICLSVAEEMPVLAGILAGFLALGFLGMLIVLGGSARAGAILVGIGSVPFVPIGLIGIIGARKILDRLADREIAAREAEVLR